MEPFDLYQPYLLEATFQAHQNTITPHKKSYLRRHMSESDWHIVTIRVPFASKEHAKIAKDVMEVDRELQAHAVKRSMTMDGDELVTTFKTVTVRLARLTLNAFLENVELIIRTLDEFGPDAASFPSLDK